MLVEGIQVQYTHLFMCVTGMQWMLYSEDNGICSVHTGHIAGHQIQKRVSDAKSERRELVTGHDFTCSSGLLLVLIKSQTRAGG